MASKIAEEWFIENGHARSIKAPFLEAYDAGRAQGVSDVWGHVFQGLEEPCGCDNHRKLGSLADERERELLGALEWATGILQADLDYGGYTFTEGFPAQLEKARALLKELPVCICKTHGRSDNPKCPIHAS